jgi:cysteine synthase A
VKQYAPKMAGARRPNVLFVCADRGTAYLDTVFDPAWATKLE